MIEPRRARLAAESIELEFLHAHGDNCVLFAYRDVTITVWHGSADDVAVHVMDQVAATRIARFPGGVSGVHVVTHGAGMPTAGARSALAASARKWSAQTAAVAVVLEQAGFFGSAMRSAVTGIQMLSKAEFPIRVFGSTREAAGWLPGPHVQRTGTTLDAARFDAALQQSRVLRSATPSIRASGTRP